MNASELSRQLLFYGYSDVTDFLKNSPLNRYIYKMFLQVLPQCEIDTPMVLLFNEIYYQCVHVNYDGTPGVNVEKRYVTEAEEWLQSPSAAQLVFSIVWVLLRLKRSQTFHEECFISQITPYVEGGAFLDVARTMFTELRYVGMEVPDSFPTLTCPIDGIPKFEAIQDRTRSLDDIINDSVEKKLGLEQQFFELQEHSMAWMAVTCNYSHAVIENLVRLYDWTEERLELIDRIQKTLPRDEIINQDGFFKDLVSRIKTGNFDPEDSFTGKHTSKSYHEPDENDDYHYNMALYKASCEEDIDVVGDLKQERDHLKARIDELQKSHEMELARLEAQYKAEIDKVKKERNRLAHEPEVIKEQTPATEPKEMTLTLSEIAAFVRERFSKSGADEICTMLYGKAAEHRYLGEDTFKQIDAIVPAIIERDKPHTQIDIPTAHQVNIRPGQVINKTSEEEKS